MNDYSGLETSNEIILALEERYSGKACDEGSESNCEWADPSDMSGIIARAWDLAEPETNKLFWGVESFEK